MGNSSSIHQPHLPPEIWHEIIDLLSEDAGALKACALTTKGWTYKSQEVLLSKVSVTLSWTRTGNPGPSMQYLAATIRSNEKLGPIVKALSLTVVPFEYDHQSRADIDDQDTPRTLAFLLSRLTALEKMTLRIGRSGRHYALLQDSGFAFDQKILEAFEAISSNQIRTLELFDFFRCPIPSSFFRRQQLLRNFRFERAGFVVVDDQKAGNTGYLTKELHLLTFRPSHRESESFTELVKQIGLTESAQSSVLVRLDPKFLRTFRTWDRSVTHYASLVKLLKRAGATLEVLEIVLTHRSGSIRYFHDEPENIPVGNNSTLFEPCGTNTALRKASFFHASLDGDLGDVFYTRTPHSRYLEDVMEILSRLRIPNLQELYVWIVEPTNRDGADHGWSIWQKFGKFIGRDPLFNSLNKLSVSIIRASNRISSLPGFQGLREEIGHFQGTSWASGPVLGNASSNLDRIDDETRRVMLFNDLNNILEKGIEVDIDFLPSTSQIPEPKLPSF
ncbi:hypothetical protein FA15DRAFT_758827 [Coprinopsis marcescibilis]|uniref:F-box domain-containing protein n=1 Tax=Coprinopsis marcescibilis TaxID=230819 RepID=A0A5C3KMJ6_COPMA|nr:hypothetical protein FA15DRAFT_758827 [Coprinopsis marcescibilis]